MTFKEALHELIVEEMDRVQGLPSAQTHDAMGELVDVVLIYLCSLLVSATPDAASLTNLVELVQGQIAQMTRECAEFCDGERPAGARLQ